jgi:hypothetical protein
MEIKDTAPPQGKESGHNRVSVAPGVWDSVVGHGVQHETAK